MWLRWKNGPVTRVEHFGWGKKFATKEKTSCETRRLIHYARPPRPLHRFRCLVNGRFGGP